MLFFNQLDEKLNQSRISCLELFAFSCDWHPFHFFPRLVPGWRLHQFPALGSDDFQRNSHDILLQALIGSLCYFLSL